MIHDSKYLSEKSKHIAQKESKKLRSPIVVVMGHIDHGKTKILDWYRKTKLVEEESGGITQHIGAYEVLHQGKKITFIDTPGHEAFSKMRSRGAHVADIAVLVVAADEGVKPQTKEAIEIIKSNGMLFVVALNKIDKPEANAERVKQQLAELEILVESYGGKVPLVEISAKTGQNMDDLLEVLLLLADLEHLEFDAEKTEGVVIESHRDAKRGVTSTLLLRNGTLRQGDILAIGKLVEVAKILEDFRGVAIESAEASAPIRLTGLSGFPEVGDPFLRFATKKEAENYIKNMTVEVAEKSQTIKLSGGSDRPIFNIILKTDVAGSREVLEELLKKMENESIGISILKSEVGAINESDLKLALATKLVTVVGFKVKIDASARELAERANIHIVQGDIIYEVIDAIKRLAEVLIPPYVTRLDLGKAKILKVFKKEGQKQIVGGRVDEGMIKKGAKIELKRFKESIGKGSIMELRQEKQEVQEVRKGQEFGILAEMKMGIEEGDVIEIFEEEIKKRTL